RIHEAELQQKVFGLLNISPDEQREKFGFLLDALAMGAPPHGGIASGIERLLMALLDEPFIRELVAFPKNQAGVDPMSGAPTTVDQAQLDELGIALKLSEKKPDSGRVRSEEHTSELQSPYDLVCRLLLEKKNCTV